MFKNNQKTLFLFTVIFMAGLFLSCSCLKKGQTTQQTGVVENQAQEEFRAAWVASVANINWPSKPGLSTEEQQKEAIVMLDFLKNNKFNAVIFQVRPQADALYDSKLEPWSYYLTGKQGQAPNPYYDPLTFWVKEAHDRGLELHVWLNPYRAHHVSGGKLEEVSIVNKMPESVVKLKEGYWWFDPSRKTTQDHSTAVVMDLVKRYDIDGVHFDDYFYPYESYNGGEDFPDDDSWNDYQKKGGKLSRGDWRRESVNKFIKNLYTEIKKEKKYVKFGLSPFGIWRPGYPSSIEGFDQYNKLYADARLWLNEGWVDYFSPQLYWPIGRIPQSYPVLLSWWQSENLKGRHLWPGINVGVGKNARGADEIESQIMISRAITPKSPGVIHWSISGPMRNDTLMHRLTTNTYKKEALVPASSWLKEKQLAKPALTQKEVDGKIQLEWKPASKESSFKTIVYTKYGTTWNYTVWGSKANSVNLEKSTPAGQLMQVEIAFIDRSGYESERAVIKL